MPRQSTHTVLFFSTALTAPDIWLHFSFTVSLFLLECELLAGRIFVLFIVMSLYLEQFYMKTGLNKDLFE